jgi:hypothetical protein
MSVCIMQHLYVKWGILSMNSMGQLRRFTRKHDRLLSVIGAIIIFITFLVREAIRDDLKELVNSIDAAEGVFMIRSDSRDVAEEIEYVRAYLTDRRIGLLVQRSPRAYYRGLIAELDSSLHLLAKVPHGGEFNTEAKDLLAKSDKVGDEMLYPLPPLPDNPPTPAQKAAETVIVEAETKSWREAVLLDRQVRDFSTRVLTLARQVEATEEDHYRLSKWASFILFAIGSGLALIGKIVGVKNLKISE